MIGDGARLLFPKLFLRDGESLVERIRPLADPALRIARFDARIIHLRKDGDGSGNLRGLALCAGHAAEARRDEQPSGEVAAFRDAELETARVQERVERAVDDALRADVHPASGGHLAVVCDAQRGGAVEILLIVECADHQSVRDDAARRQLMRPEQPERVAGHDDQCLLVGHDLEIFADQTVLHPVLADLSGLAVGDKLIGIERDVEIQIVVDHHLKRPGFDAVSAVFVDGPAEKAALRAEAVAVNTAVLVQLLREFLRHLRVVVGMDITQRVADGEGLVGLSQMGFAARCAAAARNEGRIFRKLVVETDGHGLLNCLVHASVPSF